MSLEFRATKEMDAKYREVDAQGADIAAWQTSHGASPFQMFAIFCPPRFA